jgi:hypothetical protein
MRNHLIVAVLIIVEELLIGSGLGVATILVAAAFLIAYFANRLKNRHELILAGVYAFAAISSGCNHTDQLADR